LALFRFFLPLVSVWNLAGFSFISFLKSAMVNVFTGLLEASLLLDFLPPPPLDLGLPGGESQSAATAALFVRTEDTNENEQMEGVDERIRTSTTVKRRSPIEMFMLFEALLFVMINEKRSTDCVL
jgi:hypothetical protein